MSLQCHYNGEKFISLVNKLFHLTMLALGCYFIYQGEVIQKYNSKMTNMAVTEEDIYALPTIKTWITTSHLKLGKDFHIQYKAGTWRTSEKFKGEYFSTDS